MSVATILGIIDNGDVCQAVRSGKLRNNYCAAVASF